MKWAPTKCKFTRKLIALISDIGGFPLSDSCNKDVSFFLSQVYEYKQRYVNMIAELILQVLLAELGWYFLVYRV
jgi:hypothetical protein